MCAGEALLHTGRLSTIERHLLGVREHAKAGLCPGHTVAGCQNRIKIDR